MPADASAHLGANITQLRNARGLSQQQCARLSGIPRPTWASLESGSANPTLSVLLNAASALQVSVEELLQPPRAATQFYEAGSLPERTRAGCKVRQLLPDSIVGLQIERLEIPARGGFTGVPHTSGTREYLVCERGHVTLSVAGQSWKLGPGDALAFRGDQKHAYRNPTGARAVAYSVIALAPA